MPRSLGDLADRLSITNIKLFMVQDKVNAAAAAGTPLDAATTRQLVSLNRQRNVLMTEIDEVLAQAVQTGVVDVDPRPKL